MASRALSREEGFGLALAALGHAGLVWLLVTAPAPQPLPPPERVSVTLSDEIGAVSTAPNPASDPVADKGPELGEPASAPEPAAAEPPAPVPPAPAPAIRPQPVPQPRASAVQPPRPAPAPPKVQPRPPRQNLADLIKLPQTAKTAPAKAAPAKSSLAKAPPAKAGASSFDQAFSKGIPGGSAKGKDQTPAASQASAQQVSSWSSSINARVRGPWNSCSVSGLDTGKLRAAVRFTLGRDGRIQSIEPFDVTGVTDANQPQVTPFRKCIAKALQLAAPFPGLPPEFHDQWKSRKLNFYKQ